ncbi:MAG: hypothetical protein LBL46_03535 [Rickettsiales bacterium]|nr:hypothetical protein [Rickettsiales bacterium]
MQKFSDFSEEKGTFPGDKIKMEQILGKDIIVNDFAILPSRKKEGSDYLTLAFEMDGKPFVVFTGSVVLAKQCEKYKAHFPFSGRIKKVWDYYTFE